jgi:hypothetical protein
MLKPEQMLLAALLVCTTAAADTNKVVDAAIGGAIEAGFSELERQLIGEFYGRDGDRNSSSAKKQARQGKGGMPGGQAGRGKLPPGLAQQLHKNGTLPPGLAKRALPGELQQQLPPLRAGYERQIIEDATIVLVETATGRIVDIITDAITGH